ncbi:40S ribosomal S27, partial [Fusarium agapanthi]
ATESAQRQEAVVPLRATELFLAYLLPTHLASLKSDPGFRQAFPFSQETDKTFSRKSDKMVLAVDLLNPSPAAEAKKHKLKTLVPAPRSFFMDVKCPGCFTITTVFSHAQTVVICQGCTTVLCQPTGGKARLTEGCSFRRK